MQILLWFKTTLFIINSLWPRDAIWRQISGSTLAEVLACCLVAPSHYLKQCWLIISKVKWHSSMGNLTRDISALNHWNYLKNQVPKMPFKFPRGLWVNKWLWIPAIRTVHKFQQCKQPIQHQSAWTISGEIPIPWKQALMSLTYVWRDHCQYSIMRLHLT